MATISVCLLTGEFPPMAGGMGDYTRELARALLEKGAEPFVLTSQKAQADTPYPLPILSTVPKWDFSALGQVAKALQRENPALLHIQYQAAAYDMHAAVHLLPWRLRWLGPPLKTVVTFHDLRLPYLFPKAGPLRLWALRILAHGGNAVITAARQDEKVVRSWGISRVQTVPIGSNIHPRPPAGYSREEWRKRLGVDSTEILLAYFGFLNQSKGGEVLIQALAELVRKGRRAKLLMVGGMTGSSDPTDQVYAKKVWEVIAELGLQERVLWTGFVSQGEVSAHLLAADIAVLPYQDGVSLRRGSLMAALAHGLPIVSTFPQGEPEGIVDGENMTLAPIGDAGALAQKIEVLADSPQLRERLSQGARVLAQAFSWDKIAKKHLEVYRELLGGI